jgi:hypothetical protein
MQNVGFIDAPSVKLCSVKETASVSIQNFTQKNVHGLMNAMFVKRNLLHVMIWRGIVEYILGRNPFSVQHVRKLSVTEVILLGI